MTTHHHCSWAVVERTTMIGPHFCCFRHYFRFPRKRLWQTLQHQNINRPTYHLHMTLIQMHTRPLMESPRKPAGSSPNTGTQECAVDGCTQRFGNLKEVQGHRQRQHLRYTKYTGKRCNTLFSRFTDRKLHEDVFHNKDRIFHSTHCTVEKKFSAYSKKSLPQHLISVLLTLHSEVLTLKFCAK